MAIIRSMAWIGYNRYDCQTSTGQKTTKTDAIILLLFHVLKMLKYFLFDLIQRHKSNKRAGKKKTVDREDGQWTAVFYATIFQLVAIISTSCE